MKKLIFLSILIFLLFSPGCERTSKKIDNEENQIYNNINNLTNVSINNTNENESINETNLTNEISEVNDTKECIETDGGKDYTHKGVVSAANGKLIYVTDRCENTGTLVEYYCKTDKTVGTEIYHCYNLGFVCDNGSCGDVDIINNSTNQSNTTNSS